MEKYTHITKEVAEIMGKREWEVAKVGESDKFFRVDILRSEDPDLLPIRKEIWDCMWRWMGPKFQNVITF